MCFKRISRHFDFCFVFVLFCFLRKVEEYIDIFQARSSQKDRRIVLRDCCVYKTVDKAKVGKANSDQRSGLVNHQRLLRTEEPWFEIIFLKFECGNFSLKHFLMQ